MAIRAPDGANNLLSGHDDGNRIAQIEDNPEIGLKKNCPNYDQLFSASHQCQTLDNITKNRDDKQNQSHNGTFNFKKFVEEGRSKQDIRKSVLFRPIVIRL